MATKAFSRAKHLAKSKVMLLLASMALAVLLASGVVLAQPAAQPGDLDRSFQSGGGGADDMALQPDGKVVVVGPAYKFSPEGDPPAELARLNPDGSLDETFGGDGKVDLFSLLPIIRINDVAIQEDSKILIAGESSDSSFFLARFDPNGALDTTFDGDGWLTTSLNSSYSWIWSIALQDNGKIVAAGVAGSNRALARYNPDGSLDKSFHSDGKRLYRVGGEALGVLYLNVRPHGKILMAGTEEDDTERLVLLRFNSDGTLDNNFSGDGRLVLPGSANATDLVVQPDGKFVTTNGEFPATGTTEFALSRYNPDGTLDKTFGKGGKVTTVEETKIFGSVPLWATASRLVLRPNGKIVAAGEYWGVEGEGSMLVARYYPSGKLDRTFGDGGVARHHVNDRDVYTGDFKVQPDGKLLWSGYGCDWNACYSRLLRVVGGKDTVPPGVRWTEPDDEANRVGRGSNILAHFSEDMKPSSINGRTVNLYRGAVKPANEVSATVRCGMTRYVRGRPVCTAAVLNPSKRLSAHKVYRVVVEGAGDGDARAVRDPAGNAMRADYRWNFTTSS